MQKNLRPGETVWVAPDAHPIGAHHATHRNRAPFSPAFLAGEKVPTADDRASPEHPSPALDGRRTVVVGREAAFIDSLRSIKRGSRGAGK